VLLGAAMVAVWLLLNTSWSVGQLLLGTALSLGLLWFASRLRPLRPRLYRAGLAGPLLATVMVDIVRSNLGVARVVLGLTGGRQVRSGFVQIPLELRDPHGLAVLAAIVTATPGTSFAGVSADGRTLTLHVLDLQDEAHLVASVKQHYERPLMRIFEP
jgi:multicomponent K+:H+ antiporter subunit E